MKNALITGANSNPKRSSDTLWRLHEPITTMVEADLKRNQLGMSF